MQALCRGPFPGTAPAVSLGVTPIEAGLMQRVRTATTPDSDTETIACGAMVLDIGGFTVTVEGQDVPVTLAEFLLLKQLALNPYRVLDRATLATVLGRRGFVYDVHPISLRTVDLHISRLRKKLRQAGYDCIKTMRFVGYRFVPLGST
jgi:DNA-binding response OmpR family regulator